MAQTRHGKECHSPAAHGQRRRHVGRKGVAPAQQQIDEGDEGSHGRSAIEHDIKQLA